MCLDICGHSDDKLWILLIYVTSSWAVDTTEIKISVHDADDNVKLITVTSNEHNGC